MFNTNSRGKENSFTDYGSSTGANLIANKAN